MLQHNINMHENKTKKTFMSIVKASNEHIQCSAKLQHRSTYFATPFQSNKGLMATAQSREPEPTTKLWSLSKNLTKFITILAFLKLVVSLIRKPLGIICRVRRRCHSCRAHSGSRCQSTRRQRPGLWGTRKKLGMTRA